MNKIIVNLDKKIGSKIRRWQGKIDLTAFVAVLRHKRNHRKCAAPETIVAHTVGLCGCTMLFHDTDRKKP